MPAIEIGRICTKTAGREAGRKCVVVDLLDKNFALITGPQAYTGVKRRRANMDHLSPSDEKIDLKKGAPDEDVGKVVEKLGWTRLEKKRVVKEKPAEAEEKAKEEAKPARARRAKPKAPAAKEKKTTRRKKKE